MTCPTCYDQQIEPHTPQDVLDHPDRTYYKLDEVRPKLYTFCSDCKPRVGVEILMGFPLTPDEAREWAIIRRAK